MPLGRMIMTVVFVAIGAHALYTMRRDGGLSFVRNATPPAGEWINLATGFCAASDLRFHFGNTIVIHDKNHAIHDKNFSKTFASDAFYGSLNKGQQRIKFTLGNEAKGYHSVRIDYRVTPDALTPQAVQVDGGERPLSTEFLGSFTFVRCDRPSA